MINVTDAMTCDSHIHVGQFNDQYYTPKNIHDFLTGVGVHKYAVSSTTTCSEDYEKILAEMREVVRIGPDSVVPVLWISPAMLHNGWLTKFMNCGIRWKCLKIHGYFSNWDTESEEFEKVIHSALELNVPLLLHTGGKPESDAGNYLSVIKRHPEQIFILAHSRPVEQTISVMKQCPNAWADTAFTPTEHVAQLIRCGFADRVMFGTDYPSHHYFYKGQDMQRLYHKIIADIQATMDSEEWNMVSNLNFERLFVK